MDVLIRENLSVAYLLSANTSLVFPGDLLRNRKDVGIAKHRLIRENAFEG